MRQPAARAPNAAHVHLLEQPGRNYDALPALRSTKGARRRHERQRKPNVLLPRRGQAENKASHTHSRKGRGRCSQRKGGRSQERRRRPSEEDSSLSRHLLVLENECLTSASRNHTRIPPSLAPLAHRAAAALPAVTGVSAPASQTAPCQVKVSRTERPSLPAAGRKQHPCTFRHVYSLTHAAPPWPRPRAIIWFFERAVAPAAHSLRQVYGGTWGGIPELWAGLKARSSVIMPVMLKRMG